MSDVSFDVAVIGNGLAGVTAAYHAALSGVSVSCFAGELDLPGGLAANVGALDGFPATVPVGGMELAMHLIEEGTRLGVRSVATRIDAIALTSVGRFRLSGDGRSWDARQVIIASGARLKMIDVPGVAQFIDKGINQCAWCNGGLYQKQEVVVVGGGDAAVQEALHLAHYADSVTIVTHGDVLRARRHYIDQAANEEKMQFRWDAELVEVLGDVALTGLRIRDKLSGELEDLPCTGIFVYIGQQANSELAGELVERDARGFIRTDDKFETTTPGLFAVGAVRSGFVGRLTNAVGEGSAAGVIAAGRVAQQP